MSITECCFALDRLPQCLGDPNADEHLTALRSFVEMAEGHGGADDRFAVCYEEHGHDIKESVTDAIFYLANWFDERTREAEDE